MLLALTSLDDIEHGNVKVTTYYTRRLKNRLTKLARHRTLLSIEGYALTGETGVSQSRRSNRPGNSQANGPSVRCIWRVVGMMCTFASF